MTTSLIDHLNNLDREHPNFPGLLKMLIEARVKRFSQAGESVELEFFPPSPVRESGAIVPKSMTQDAPHQEDMCACGHSIPAHDQGGNCYMGCELAKCIASVAK